MVTKDSPGPPGKPALRRLIVALLVVLFVLVVYYFGGGIVRRGRFGLRNTQVVVSSVDGMRYRVHRAHADPDRAADTMAELNRRVIVLLRRLREEYVRGGGRQAFPGRAAATARLLERYNPDSLAENSPRDPDGDTSYVMRKGSLVALCLREREAKASGRPGVHDFHDLNTLTFVTLHEMGHIAVEVLDHPPEFWSAFKFLLTEAVGARIYVPEDYERAPEQYCGMTIDYNPFYDRALAATK